MWVAKIGGSLAQASELEGWLAAFCCDPERRWLLVPGGGAYADRVRETQRRWAYSDELAHWSAVQAMSLYAARLAALEPRLLRCYSIAEASERKDRQACLWCPSLADETQLKALPADWRVSSDSIALVLAARLQAEALVLVKSSAPGLRAQAGSLAAAGYIDALLPTLLGTVALPVYAISKDALPVWPEVPGAWPPASARILAE